MQDKYKEMYKQRWNRDERFTFANEDLTAIYSAQKFIHHYIENYRINIFCKTAFHEGKHYWTITVDKMNDHINTKIGIGFGYMFNNSICHMLSYYGNNGYYVGLDTYYRKRYDLVQRRRLYWNSSRF